MVGNNARLTMSNKTSNNLSIGNLELHRGDILKAEIGALLFNLGKTHIGFWKEKNGVIYFNIDDNAFKTQFGYSLFSGYKKYYEEHNDIGKSPFEYELEKISSNFRDFIFKKEKVKLPDNSEIEWKEFFYGNSSDKPFIKKIFFRGCENINSGIDKGSPQDSNQLKTLWISNAFGSLNKEVTDENDFDASRLCFLRSLHRFLEDNNYYNSPDWVEIRNFVFKEIKLWYSRLLSDSRFPVNDVTLWEQAYMTASMFKATLAGLYLDNSRQQDFIDNPQKIKWSILGIQYDKLGLAEKGLKAASISWYRNASKEVDEAIKKLIEIEYPLGNEVYRDETGIYFVVAENIKKDKDKKDKKEGNDPFYKLHDDLSVIKAKIQEIFADKFGGEVYPAIFLTEPSRGLMNLGYLVEEARENFLKAEIPGNFKNYLKDDLNPNGICQICGMRLAHKDNKENLICNVCLKRQKDRIDNWFKHLKEETIWTDELQDKNGRIALITLKFELDKWTNGDLVNSLLVNNSKFIEVYNDVIATCTDFNSVLNALKNKLLEEKSNTLQRLAQVQNAMNSISYEKRKLVDELKQIQLQSRDIGKCISLFNSMKQLSFNTLKNKIETFFDKLLSVSDNDVFNYVSKIYGVFTSSEFEDLKREIENTGRPWNSIVNEKDFFKKLQNKGFSFQSNIGISKEKFFKIIDNLKETTDKIGFWVKKEDRDIVYFKKIVIENLYPFKYASDMLNYFRGNYANLQEFHEILLFNAVEGNSWNYLLKNEWIDSSDNTKRIKWKSLSRDDLTEISKLIAQFLLRKNPSPARLRRIWETTREFFEDLESRITELAGIPEERRKRLVWNNVEISNGSGDYKEKEFTFNKLVNFWIDKDGKAYLISSLLNSLDLLKANKTENDKIIQAIKDNETNWIKKELQIKPYEDTNSNIELTLKGENIEIQTYKPYFTILSPTPISWQFIIPAEYVPNLIENVQKEYYKNFKWVYGKLPLHIGIVVQDYKKPLYVGIKALRRIRRDKQDWGDLRIPLSAKDFKARQKEAFHYQENPEQVADCENFYPLFERTDGNQKRYDFYLYPHKNRVWIDTTQDASDTDKFYFYRNTFDFEFLDTNVRRNDIFYKKAKRTMTYKQNRPYDIEDWQYFEQFRQYFKDKKTSSKLHKLVSLIYSKLEDWKDDPDAIKTFMLSAFINILELNQGNRDIFAGILGLKDWDEFKNLEKDKFIKKLYMFLDMFEFWHTTLKEV